MKRDSESALPVNNSVCVHFMINNSPKMYELFIVTVFYRSDPLSFSHSADTLSQYMFWPMDVQLRLFSVLALKGQSKCKCRCNNLLNNTALIYISETSHYNFLDESWQL